MANTQTEGLKDLFNAKVPYEEIIDGRTAKENGSFLSLFNTIKATGKPTEVYVEKESAMAKITPELTSPLAKDNKLEKKQLTLKRFATKIEVSQQFINDSAVDYESYLTDLLTKRLILGLEQGITYVGDPNGNTNGNIQLLSQGANGFTSANTFNKVEIEFELVQKLASSFFDINKRENCFWIFNTYTQVTNKAGNDCITYDNLPHGAVGRLLGIPIYISQLTTSVLGKQMACVLVNPNAYTLVLGDIKIEQLKQGTDESVRGVHVFQGELYADGVVTNPNARMAIEYAPEIKQASVTEQSIDEPKPAKRKATKIEKE
ncbi:phage major capsid protein [Bacillus mycoides]|uniref:phage major capsid protein n=1 Tax=Bacillus mycoides TaxID=1405 RepID=UPI0021127733|nr:phage major capsid protein [Bacillus mycoides]MCQ6527464.1 phage major capsid protein [Bacillus mycoides]